MKINLVFAQVFIDVNERKACSNFYNAVKNDELPFLKGVWPEKKYNDFGFYVKRIWDSEKQKYISEKDKDGNLKVGEIYSMKAYNSLKTEDSIIQINDKKINNVDQFNEIYNEDIKKIKIKLKDKNDENYLVYLDKHENKYTYLNYSIKDLSISELDLKKGFYELAINQSFSYEYKSVDNLDDKLHEYVQLGHKYLIGKITEDDENEFTHICDPTEEDMMDNEINNPVDVTILNVLRDDNDLQKKKIKN